MSTRENILLITRVLSVSHSHMYGKYKLLWPGPEVIKLFPYSTQLRTKLIMLINVKMPTFVGILTFISIINTTGEFESNFSAF